MEDIDVGMPDGSIVSPRVDDSDGDEETVEGKVKGLRKRKPSKSTGGITLSGLLNAIVSDAA